MADKTLERAKVAGIIGGGVIVAGLAGFLLYRAIKPAGDAVASIGQAASNVGGAVNDVAASTRNVTSTVRNVTSEVGSTFAPIAVPKYDNSVDAAKGQLHIINVQQANINKDGWKRNHLTVRITDQNGAPVAGASVRVAPKYGASWVFSQWKTTVEGLASSRWVTNSRGEAYMELDVQSMDWAAKAGLIWNGTEDDFWVWAQKAGYNDSNKIAVT